MTRKTPITPDAARLRMADLCARSEQCSADIRQKLLKAGLNTSQAEAVIASLVTDRFIDDARFARSFARDKCRFSGWGRNKIRVMLMAKRIPAQEISAALEAIDPDDYLDALQRAAKAKARTLDLTGENARDQKAKLFRHILSRGFESALASKAVAEMTRRAHEEEEEE